jgi:hypothetical protein
VKRGRRLRAALGFVGFSLAVVASAASASGGAVQGLQVDPALTLASVENLSVTYDGCPADVPDCSWQATATLVPPRLAPCPPEWSWLMEAEESPPGLPPPPPGSPPYNSIQKVWSAETTGNGVLLSGPLQLQLGGVNDNLLCLYAQHYFGPSAYVPHLPEEADLVASQLLHVDLLPQSPPPATAPAEPRPRKRCAKGKRRTVVRGKKRCRRIKRHDKSRRGAGPGLTRRTSPPGSRGFH